MPIIHFTSEQLASAYRALSCVGGKTSVLKASVGLKNFSLGLWKSSSPWTSLLPASFTAANTSSWLRFLPLRLVALFKYTGSPPLQC